MPGLETAFYIIGIVFMVLSLLVLIALAVATLIIRNRVVTLERTMQEKFHDVAKSTQKIVEVASAVREVARAVKK